MARYKPEHKAQTRRNIVDTAINHFRGGGVDATSIDDVMKELGLTVGGFYRHFGSKSDLLAEAVAQGVEQSVAFIRSVPEPSDGRSWHEAAAALYLTCPHRENIARGCLLAALGPEIGRADEKVRAACEAGLLRVREETRARLGPTAAGEPDRFWAFLALCMGGLVLSRMVADPKTAEDILRSCRQGAGSLAR
jgi:TetR/AcrR family transcriptional repressor of nem operon